MDMIWVWTIIIAVSLVVEFITLQMVSIWFAVGGAVGLLLSLINGVDVYWQILVAIIISVVCIIYLRKISLKFLNRKSEDAKVEPLIGKRAKLLEDITDENGGTIRVNGGIWTAISDKTLPSGIEVEVIEVVGNKLKVKRVERENEEYSLEKEMPTPLHDDAENNK